MIKFDFHTYVDRFIHPEDYQRMMRLKDDIMARFQKSDMIGWVDDISPQLVEDIKDCANFIKSNFDCLVVVGIGGSFLGSYAVSHALGSYFFDQNFPVIYAGTTLSSKYLDELLEYLKDKNFCLNVISKSGSTMESSIAYQLLKDLLKRKYDEDEIRKHIIITTGDSGVLRDEASREHYKSYFIPDNVGGRFSFLSPAHLLPLALNYSIDDLIVGYRRGKRLQDYAFEYAVLRNLLFQQGKYIEDFCVFEENFQMFTEWLKQLFGESEGKGGLGIYPSSLVYTRDLHSLGQFIQEGKSIIFETFFKVEKMGHYLDYKGRSLEEVSHVVLDSVIRAHYSGGVPCLEITLDEVREESIATLIYFFQLSASYSALLFGLNPFDQPGVEVYKKEVLKSLGE